LRDSFARLPEVLLRRRELLFSRFPWRGEQWAGPGATDVAVGVRVSFFTRLRLPQSDEGFPQQVFSFPFFLMLFSSPPDVRRSTKIPLAKAPHAFVGSITFGRRLYEFPPSRKPQVFAIADCLSP